MCIGSSGGMLYIYPAVWHQCNGGIVLTSVIFDKLKLFLKSISFLSSFAIYSFATFIHPSNLSEIESRLPKAKLITLCKHESILKWMCNCDHGMYQALVEILIPDVLRPIPSKLNADKYGCFCSHTCHPGSLGKWHCNLEGF